MAAGIGNLVIRLGLDAVEFTRGLAESETRARNSGSKIGDALKVAGKGALALGAAAVTAAAGLAVIVKGAIDAADELGDMSKKTGIAVDVLGGLGFAATQAGGDLESVVSGAVKLNKAIAEAAGGNRDFADAFKTVGISVKEADGKLRSADKVLLDIADKFSTYEDGARKAALATAFFGKVGVDQIVFLNDSGESIRKNIEYYQKYAGVTTEVSEQAGEFNDGLARLQLLSGAFGRSLAAELLPSLNVLVANLIKAKEEGNGFKDVVKIIADDIKLLAKGAVYAVFALATFADGAVTAAKTVKEFFSFGGRAKVKELDDALLARIAGREKALKVITDALDAANGGAGSGTPEVPGAPKTPAPALPGKDAEAQRKKLIDAALSDLERQSSREQEILSSRNIMLELYNDQNLLSTKEYYAGRRAAQDEALRESARLIDEQIAVLERGRKAEFNASGRTEIDTKINELLEKKNKLVRDGGNEALAAAAKEQKANEDYARSIGEISAQLLDLQGKSGEAQRIRLDAQFKDVNERTAVNGDEAGAAQAAGLRKAIDAQNAFNEAGKEAADVQTRLANAEALAAISRAQGVTGELGYFEEVSVARRAAAKDLEAIVAQQEAVAAASGNPALVLQAQSARVALAGLRAESDLVSQKLTDTFQNGFESAFGDFITGTKSASDAFRSFGASVIAEIGKIIAKQAALALFGGGKAGGGILGGLGLISSIGGLFTGTPGASNITPVPTGGLATGGAARAGNLYEVAERGPELLETGGKQFLMMGKQNGLVKPNSSMKAGSEAPTQYTIVNNTTGRIDSVQEVRVSDKERALIISEAVRATSSEMYNPNSRVSKALRDSTNVQRSRG